MLVGSYNLLPTIRVSPTFAPFFVRVINMFVTVRFIPALYIIHYTDNAY